jgi:hypothetical protein
MNSSRLLLLIPVLITVIACKTGTKREQAKPFSTLRVSLTGEDHFFLDSIHLSSSYMDTGIVRSEWDSLTNTSTRVFDFVPNGPVTVTLNSKFNKKVKKEFNLQHDSTIRFTGDELGAFTETNNLRLPLDSLLPGEEMVIIGELQHFQGVVTQKTIISKDHSEYVVVFSAATWTLSAQRETRLEKRFDSSFLVRAVNKFEQEWLDYTRPLTITSLSHSFHGWNYEIAYKDRWVRYYNKGGDDDWDGYRNFLKTIGAPYEWDPAGQ